MNKLLMTTKEVFSASRYGGREFARFFTLAHLALSSLLLFAPLAPAKFIVTPSIWLWLFTCALSTLGTVNIFREYLHVHDYHSDVYRRKLIHNLLALLNRCYNWQGQCRITLFMPVLFKGKWYITPYERAGAGAPPGLLGSKVYFSKDEGLPGKAWGKAWDGNDINKLPESIIIADIPDHVIGKIEETKQ